MGCDWFSPGRYRNGKFLLTHPVWDVTDSYLSTVSRGRISTHTSRVGCDVFFLRYTGIREKFLLTHPVWDVTAKFVMIVTPVAFLLTHPVWDVTTRAWRTHESHRFLLTHPVWDVTVLLLRLLALRKNFYSHIPCGMWPLYIVYFNHIIPIYYRMDL